jgi:hypothetical protein
MLTKHRREQRTRRQPMFTLETLDDRLVLSAVAAGAAAEAAGAKAALVEQRHEAKLARVQARHEAKMARLAAAHATSSAAIAIPITNSASASATPAAASSSSTTSSPAAVTTSGSSATSSTSGQSSQSSSPSQAVSNPLPINVAAALQSLYAEYQKAGSGEFTPSQPSDKMLQISGTSVAVDLKIGSGADLNTVLSQLKSDGMQVSSSSSTYGLIDGMLPISQLPAAAQIASSVNPTPAPHLS